MRWCRETRQWRAGHCTGACALLSLEDAASSTIRARVAPAVTPGVSTWMRDKSLIGLTIQPGHPTPTEAVGPGSKVMRFAHWRLRRAAEVDGRSAAWTDQHRHWESWNASAGACVRSGSCSRDGDWNDSGVDQRRARRPPDCPEPTSQRRPRRRRRARLTVRPHLSASRFRSMA